MASRQEEKERRRQERLEREAAEARAAGTKRRLQLVFGGMLALAAIAAVSVAVASAIGGDDGPKQADTRRDPDTAAAAQLPAQELTDVKAAAKAAGCELSNPEYEGAGHDPDKTFTPADYKTNPPTSGAHFPEWYEDGIYEPGDTPNLGMLVHTLEHGRIDVQYKPGTAAETVKQLEAFLAENEGYHMLLFENTTKMPYAVAATAWTHSLGCKEMNPKVFDALRTFRDEYIDKGPEPVP